MRFDSLTTLLAVSNILLGVSAGPLAAKRQDESTSAPSSAPTAALVVSTMSDGKPTTFEVVGPQPTRSDSSQSATITGDASASPSEEPSKTTYTFSRTGQPLPPSTDFPSCHATDAKPFCLPNNESTLYAGSTYYVTWNPDFFPINSTVTVKLTYANNSEEEVWSSPETENSWGVATVTMKKEWMQGYSRYNLTFFALNYEGDDPTKQSTPFKGPTIELRNQPPRHYAPPKPTKMPNKLGLMIGLPVSLGFVFVVVVGLYLGMRSQRKIGLGNIMGRKKGYGVGKSRRQRMRLGKKGAIRLEEGRAPIRMEYQDAPHHGRDNSLGSLVSDDEIRPAPRGNQFRDEVQRQRTGR
ncbi:hypothetical protein K469DRAFT_707967 [Zopfia rhizophila CBS 207.26]|uniref:Uncharacterized protein n=1 Tax=Zopfia rhizophila CBS 207.26 TaxID=1314779 RepID=A0A6A6E2F3_9PEZI|nr:hypothetical protein K469DRAFT_707967 [Zopfia rhizophila CBS 207.26]